MFNKGMLDSIFSSAEEYLRITIQDRANTLKERYLENPYIKEAIVEIDGEEVNIKLTTTFEPRDKEQDIVLVFEYGGIIFDKKGKKYEIEPNYYIGRTIANGIA